MPIPDLNAIPALDALLDNLPIKENPLASQLGIKSTNDNLLQFYNRFGENNLAQKRALSTVIAKPYYFTCIWSFVPEGESNVESLLKASMQESTVEALKYFVQNVQLPDIDTYSPMEVSNTEFGNVANTGLYVKPSSNEFTIAFLSTEFSLHEHVFYYWLRECQSNKWVYSKRPYSKAKLRISFFDSEKKNYMFSYVLTNVFPLGIETLKPSHAPDETLTRNVTFTFDNIYVMSANKVVSTRIERAFDRFIGDKIKRTLTTGVNQNLPDLNIPQ